MGLMTFSCPVCRQLLSADSSFAGKKMRCPLCEATINVPATAAVPERELVGATAGPANTSFGTPAPPRRINAPLSTSNQRFGFNCVYCSSRLEATQSMSGTQGQCPTCGSTIYIPILNRSGQLIDPVTQKIIKPDPHPVHAYAAAGERAPSILRDAQSGKQLIVCRRCGESNPITANNCRGCGMPFTIEGTTNVAASSGGYGAAALVLGIIALPLSCLLIPAVLAIIFGALALRPDSNGGSRGSAIAGIVLGGISLLIFFFLQAGRW